MQHRRIRLVALTWPIVCLAVLLATGCSEPRGVVSEPYLDVTGWNGVAWGTKPDEALKILARYGAHRAKPGESTIKIDKIEIGGAFCDVDLVFDQDANFCAADMNTLNPYHPLAWLGSVLEDRYGLPSMHEENIQHMARRWEWLRPSGRIELQQMTDGGGYLWYSKRYKRSEEHTSEL